MAIGRRVSWGKPSKRKRLSIEALMSAKMQPRKLATRLSSTTHWMGGGGGRSQESGDARVVTLRHRPRKQTRGSQGRLREDDALLDRERCGAVKPPTGCPRQKTSQPGPRRRHDVEHLGRSIRPKGVLKRNEKGFCQKRKKNPLRCRGDIWRGEKPP